MAAAEPTEVPVTVEHPAESWDGRVGAITMLFPEVAVDPSSTVVAVVGPPSMYVFVLSDLRSTGVPDDRILLSLERHMKCGVRMCGHCRINGRYVCTDRPVFSAARHILEEHGYTVNQIADMFDIYSLASSPEQKVKAN